MKNIFYILIVFTAFFSCKKERLKNEKEIFIGRWELTHTVYIRTSQYGPGSWRTTTFPKSPAPELTFKKNGKVTLVSEGEESNYKMNFRKKGSGASPYFLTEREDRYTRNDTSLVYLGSFDHFLVNFHQRPYPMVKVAGIINDDMLRINSSKTIISGGTGDSRFTYYHYFKRVSY